MLTCKSNTNNDGVKYLCRRVATIRKDSAQPLCDRQSCQPGYIRSGKIKPDISLIVDNFVRAFQMSQKYFVVAIWDDDKNMEFDRKRVEQITGFGSSYFDCECDSDDCCVCINILPREDLLVIGHKFMK